ncbi:hypothetical protein STEG23_034850, partial [Scotinomys teguina]
RTWKQPRCPSTEEWIRKMWYIYTMEYYAAEKNNDIMKFASKWMELENVILSESEWHRLRKELTTNAGKDADKRVPGDQTHAIDFGSVKADLGCQLDYIWNQLEPQQLGTPEKQLGTPQKQLGTPEKQLGTPVRDFLSGSLEVEDLP